MGYANSVVEESLKQQKFDDCYASYLLLGKRNTDVRLKSQTLTPIHSHHFSSCSNWIVKEVEVEAHYHCEQWLLVWEVRPVSLLRLQPTHHHPAEQDTEGSRDLSALQVATNPAGVVRVRPLQTMFRPVS